MSRRGQSKGNTGKNSDNQRNKRSAEAQEQMGAYSNKKTNRFSTLQNQDKKLLGLVFLLLLAGGYFAVSYQSQKTDKPKNRGASLPNDSDIDQTAVDYPVSLAQVSRRSIEKQVQPQLQKDWFSLINKQIEKIREVLPVALSNPKRLKKIFSENQLDIQVTLETDPLLRGQQSKAPTARFIPSSNRDEKHTILIVQDSDFTSSELRKTLANELHHASTISATWARAGKPVVTSSKRMLLPFLKEDGSIDPVLQKKHKEAITLGLNRVAHFRNLHKLKTRKKISIFSEAQQNEYNEFIKAFEFYEPRELHQSVPTGEFFWIEKNQPKENGKIKVPIEDGEFIYIHSSINHGSETTFHYSLVPSNQLTDKIKDFLIMLKEFEAVVYKGPYVAVSTPDELDMEFSSFIEELPGELKQLFFKEWCDYFSEYTDTLAYCGNSG